MSIWTRINEALSALRNGEGLAAVFERLRTPPERTVGFTIAVIALGAKMAKADGQVTRDEVAAFREVFHIAPEDEANAARVFNMARGDVAGFEEYATRVKAMFEGVDAPLCDLMEGLFHIAAADGTFHPGENEFLHRVSEIFGFSDAEYRRMRAQYAPDYAPDPYGILGVPADASLETVRAAWKALVRECHPDSMQARGVPQEALKLAEKRLIAINAAWEQISAKGPVRTHGQPA